MLNPELIKKYGEGTKKFFDDLRDGIGDELADKCYVVDTGRRYVYNDIVMPVFIAACTDYDTCEKIESVCFSISSKLIDVSTTATGDDFVACLPYTVEELKEKGIKVWES